MGLIKFDFSKPINAKNVLEMMNEIGNVQHIERNLRTWIRDQLAAKDAPAAKPKKKEKAA